jgi:DNA ligase (NAD+)
VENNYVTKEQSTFLPTTCPSCGAELIWEGVHLKCPNPECSDIRIQDLLVWCNSLAPIDGLGDTLKLKFFEDWNWRYDMEISVDGLYKFNASVLSSYEVNGVQQELFRKMIVKLQSGYTPNPEPVTLVSALKALNIPRLGDATADLLSHYPDDIKKLIQGEIPDNLAYKIGNANAESIISHRNKFQRLQYIYKNIQFTEEFQNSSRIKVAITGSLNSMTRSQFEKILNANGFVLGDITKDTKYLITNTPDSGSSKNAKADKLGVEKITEADFIAKYNL